MGDLIPLQCSPKKPKGEGKTQCKSGVHKWVMDPRKQFDVKPGKLVTIKRCGVTKTELS